MRHLAVMLLLVFVEEAAAQARAARLSDPVDLSLVQGERRIRAFEEDSGRWRVYRDRRGRPVRLRFFTDANHLPPSNLGPGGMGGAGYSLGEPAGYGSATPRQQP